MDNQRKQRILEKLASKSKVIGMAVGAPERAAQYLARKTRTLGWSKYLKRTGTHYPTQKQLFPIVGKREARRLQVAVS